MGRAQSGVACGLSHGRGHTPAANEVKDRGFINASFPSDILFQASSS